MRLPLFCRIGRPHHGRVCPHDRAAAASAGLEIKAHPHMLRHACGYALANKGHDTRAIRGWLGHRSITSTAVYTALAPNRFKDFGGRAGKSTGPGRYTKSFENGAR